jgi:hypothetical protein
MTCDDYCVTFFFTPPPLSSRCGSKKKPDAAYILHHSASTPKPPPKKARNTKGAEGVAIPEVVDALACDLKEEGRLVKVRSLPCVLNFDLLTPLYLKVILECDEHYHRSYPIPCECKRLEVSKS